MFYIDTFDESRRARGRARMSKAATIKQNSRLNLCELLNDSTEGNNKRWNAYANVYDLSKALPRTKQHTCKTSEKDNTMVH